jgi:hypothetical protein
VIVRQTAAEFGLPYIESPTFLSAIRSHYRILKKLGKEAYRAQKSPAARTPTPVVPMALSSMAEAGHLSAARASLHGRQPARSYPNS